MVAELPSLEPLKAVADAAASLQSLELATSFSIGQRLNLVSTLDEAARRGLAQLFAAWLGLPPGRPEDARQGRGTFPQWQALRDYWEQLGANYEYCVQALVHNPRSGPAERLPLVLVRCTRARVCCLKIEWMRYYAARDEVWAALVRLYKAAASVRLEATPVRPYRGEAGDATTVGQELAAAVMLHAAAPLTLSPRRMELAARVTSAYSGLFESGGAPASKALFRFDLDRPGRPAQVSARLPAIASPLFVGPGQAPAKLQGLLQHAGQYGSVFLQGQFGEEFRVEEKLQTIEYLLRRWGDAPPSRRHARTSLKAGISVAAGLEAIRNVLTPQAPAEAAPRPLSFGMEGERGDGKPVFAAATETWSLTDYSTRGLGARFTRRAEGALGIGTPFIFRLDRSPKWCLAVVRRMQSDARNQVEIGAEILAKSLALARLDSVGAQGGGFSLQGALLGDGAEAAGALPGWALLLHADPEFGQEASLLLEPGSQAGGQTALLRCEGVERRVKIGALVERGDAYERFAFETLPGAS